MNAITFFALTLFLLLSGCQSQDKQTASEAFVSKPLKTTILAQGGSHIEPRGLRIIRDQKGLEEAYADLGLLASDVPDDVNFSSDIVIGTFDPISYYSSYANLVDAVLHEDHIEIAIGYYYTPSDLLAYDLAQGFHYNRLTIIHDAKDLPVSFSIAAYTLSDEADDMGVLYTNMSWSLVHHQCTDVNTGIVSDDCSARVQAIPYQYLQNSINPTIADDNISYTKEIGNLDDLQASFAMTNPHETLPEALGDVNFSTHKVYALSQATHTNDAKLLSVGINKFMEYNISNLDIKVPGWQESLPENDLRQIQFYAEVEVKMAYKDCFDSNTTPDDWRGTFYASYPKKPNYFNAEDMKIFALYTLKIQSCKKFTDSVDDAFVQGFYGFDPVNLWSLQGK